MHRVRAVALRSDKHAVKKQRGSRDSAVISQIVLRDLRWGAQGTQLIAV